MIVSKAASIRGLRIQRLLAIHCSTVSNINDSADLTVKNPHISTLLRRSVVTSWPAVARQSKFGRWALNLR